MSKERTHGLGIPCQIEKGLGLLSTNRETKKEDRECEQESAFHRPRSLAAFTSEAQRTTSIGNNHYSAGKAGSATSSAASRHCRPSRQFRFYLALARVGGGVKVEAILRRACALKERSEERRVGKECRSRWSP